MRTRMYGGVRGGASDDPAYSIKESRRDAHRQAEQVAAYKSSGVNSRMFVDSEFMDRWSVVAR